MSNIRGLYIHIPFCVSKCRYCDFNSYPGKIGLAEAYFNAVDREMELYSRELGNTALNTVFIGGGTPTSVEPVYIKNILDRCRKLFSLNGDAEVSIEANPGTLTTEKLEVYRNSGINRLSIGLQAIQPNLLKLLGRTHDAGMFDMSFKAARAAGFENINIDLIFGIPGQTLEDWEETLSYVKGLSPEHVSCYSLKIEEGTPLWGMVEKGELSPMEDELDREIYYAALRELRSCLYRHYEISNLAKPGYECRHNCIYWRAEEYIGLGAGAHSYCSSRRYRNQYGIEEYVKAVNETGLQCLDAEIIGKPESMAEYMILGLRMVEGVDADNFKARYGENMMDVFGSRIKGLVEKGLLQLESGNAKLTSAGLDLANQVFVEFL